jgi:hypothetical protein
MLNVSPVLYWISTMSTVQITILLANDYGWPKPYLRCIYGILGWEITKYTVIYGVKIRFWPTLQLMFRGMQECLIPRHT